MSRQLRGMLALLVLSLACGSPAQTSPPGVDDVVAALRAGDDERAQALLDALGAAGPGSAYNVRFLQGVLHLRAGEGEQAAGVFDDLEASEGPAPALAIGRALADWAAGRHVEARARLEQAVRLWPDDPGVWANLGDVHRALAARAYRQAGVLHRGEGEIESLVPSLSVQPRAPGAAAARGIAAPDVVVTDAAVPEAAATATATPDVAAPDAAVPEAAATATAAPDVAAPDTAAPEAVAPATATPDVAAPDTAVPEAAAPATAAPDVAMSDTAVPEVAAPATATPDVAAPDTAAPEVAAPATAGTPPAAGPPEAASTECFRVGPWTGAPPAGMLEWLPAHGARILPSPLPDSSRYRVYLGPFDDRGQMMRTIASLKEQGLRDVTPAGSGPLDGTVSLGVYRNRENAWRRLRKLRAMGLEPTVLAPAELWLRGATADFRTLLADWSVAFPGVPLSSEPCPPSS